ncbi:M23 family metallopeptidase [Paenibacillus sp. 2TAB23]|uniref:M23 family metallopeptidase n=1 Tax=Paenibacillus sp. 2TAB23 TaxID=3233004 RepID=UPI003F9C2102
MKKNKAGHISDPGAIIITAFACMLILASCSGNGERNKEAIIVAEQKEEINDNLKRIGGEDIAAAMLEGEYERLYTQFSNALKDIVTLKEIRSMGQDFVSDIHSFKLTSKLQLNGQQSIVWDGQTGNKGLMAAIDEKGTINGIQIIQHSSYPQTDEAYSKTEFHFPFLGEWLVFWGGKNTFINYHYEYEPVRYAYDFVVEKNSYSYEGDPTVNESYYAFDEDVLAPAEGVVAAAVDGILDNDPVGTVNEDQPAGNMVTIRHSNGEYSTIAHLKKGSVTVKTGDTVAAGQLIGKCGNSGNSTEPHIHFQASAPADAANHATIPISFKDHIQPIRGDKVTGSFH